MTDAARPELAPPPAPRRSLGALWSFVGLAGVLVVGSLVEYALYGTVHFPLPENQCLILVQNAMVLIGAVGMTFVIISGGIDLSAASVIALSAVVAARVVLWEADPRDLEPLAGPAALWLPLAGMGAAIAAGAAVGAVNGTLITRLKLTPFIATLGMMMAARGVAKWVADLRKIDVPPNWIGAFTAMQRWDVPIPLGFRTLRFEVGFSWAVVVALGLAAVAAVVLARTRFGRHVFAVGSNEATARLCGVRVERVKLAVYALAGAAFGLAGVVNFGRLGVGDPTTAMTKELDIIAAVVIGGGSLAGGSGSILGAVVGALLMANLRNLCILLDLPIFVQEIVVGGVIIVAVAIDRLRHRRRDGSAGA